MRTSIQSNWRLQMKFNFLIVLIVLVIPFTKPATATVIISSTDGMGADADVRDGMFADMNFGTNSGLNAKDEVPDFARKTFVRFGLTPLASPAMTASLEFEINILSPFGFNPNTNHVFNVYGLSDSAPDQNWGENTITWNNAPANDIFDGEMLNTNAILLGSFFYTPSVMLGDVLTFSDPNLLSFINTDTDDLMTLIITDATGRDTGALFASGEAPGFAPPTLRLTVPEPSTSVLLILGAALFGTWRRHKK